MRRTSTVIPIVIGLLAGSLSGRAQSAYQVTFKALTAFGDPVGVHVVTLVDPLHHRDLASHCAGMVCPGVPEGPYTFSVIIDETGRKVDGSAVIYRADQVVAVDVGTPVGDLDDSAFPTINGRLTHAFEPDRVWVRLAQLYGDGSVSAKIRSDGTFQLDQVRPGNWMLMVFRDGTLLHYEPWTCKTAGNTPINIDLVESAPLERVKLTMPGSGGAAGTAQTQR